MTSLTSDTNNLHEKDFNAITFSQKQVSDKEFSHCHFTSCNFNETHFTHCEFNHCHFIDCNLNNIAINNSKFVDVVFDNCKIIGVNWTTAYWRSILLSTPLTFKKCMINSSSFFGLSLEKIIIERCRAHDVDFREATLKDGNFSHTDLKNSLFNNTNLTNANFNEAVNYDINIKNNTIKNASFCRHEAIRLLHSLGVNLID